MLILHGADTVASREKLFQETAGFEGEILRLDGHSIDLTQLKQALESRSLFGKERLVVVEGLWSRRPSKVKEALVGYLKSAVFENLIVWEGKKIDGRVLAPFRAQTRLFELSSSIFKLVESLLPENHQAKIRFLRATLIKDPPEMVLAMLARQTRLLLMVKEPPKEGLKLAPWQTARLKSQSARFSLDQLLKMHRQLLEIDLNQKSGRSLLDWQATLELWLVSF